MDSANDLTKSGLEKKVTTRKKGGPKDKAYGGKEITPLDASPLRHKVTAYRIFQEGEQAWISLSLMQ